MHPRKVEELLAEVGSEELGFWSCTSKSLSGSKKLYPHSNDSWHVCLLQAEPSNERLSYTEQAGRQVLQRGWRMQSLS